MYIFHFCNQVVDNHVIRYSSPEEYEKSAGWKPVHKNYGSVVVGALSCDPRMVSFAHIYFRKVMYIL